MGIFLLLVCRELIGSAALHGPELIDIDADTDTPHLGLNSDLTDAKPQFLTILLTMWLVFSWHLERQLKNLRHF